MNENWKPGDPIGYLRAEPPPFDLPSYRGAHYAATVPDTLDLAERAQLGLNCLTRALNPAADYELYFRVYFGFNPPIMGQDFSDVCDIKFLESMPLMRLISGSSLNEHAERGRLAARLRMIGEDGLLWDPIQGRPWITHGLRASGNPTDEAPDWDRFFFPPLAGRFLGVSALQYLLTGDKLWRQVGERLVDAFERRIMVHRDDYAFLPQLLFGPDDKPDHSMPLPPWHVAIQNEWVIQGLAQFYRSTGYEPARELAEKTSRYFAYHSGYYGPEAQFTSAHPHHHCHVQGLLAMADHALVVGDKELLEFCRKGYEHGRTLGVSLIGFFPEVYDNPMSTCESCEVADMIGLAAKLSRAGIGDYWDDVERYVRNHFAEMQLTSVDWIYRHAQTLKPRPVQSWFTGDQVPERNIGGFAGWASANEWWSNGAGIMHCCTGNATRAIHYAWDSILEFGEGRLRVNLLLNRASPWADVDSRLPNEGRVDVRVKQECMLSVRIPDWRPLVHTSIQEQRLDEVSCSVNGETRPVHFAGRYAQVGAVRPGDTVTISFPIWEHTRFVNINMKKYRLTLRGHDVVAIDPPGILGPLYQREHCRSNVVGWRKTERFVSEQQLHW